MAGKVVGFAQIEAAQNPASRSNREVHVRGTMMDFPLTLPTLLERSNQLFARVEIVSRRPDRSPPGGPKA